MFGLGLAQLAPMLPPLQLLMLYCLDATFECISVRCTFDLLVLAGPGPNWLQPIM